jgi:hypothetical protein
VDDTCNSHVDLNTLALLDAGEADTADDNEEHHVGEGGLDLNGGDDEGDDGSEDGLASLDDLGKRDGAATEGEDRATV